MILFLVVVLYFNWPLTATTVPVVAPFLAIFFIFCIVGWRIFGAPVK
jgi:hypothetical protein